MKTTQTVTTELVHLYGVCVSNCPCVQTLLAPLNYAFHKKKDAIMATMSLSKSLKVGLETFPVFISCITEPGSPGTPALPVWGLGVCQHHCSAGNESP